MRKVSFIEVELCAAFADERRLAAESEQQEG